MVNLEKLLCENFSNCTCVSFRPPPSENTPAKHNDDVTGCEVRQPQRDKREKQENAMLTVQTYLSALPNKLTDALHIANIHAH